MKLIYFEINYAVKVHDDVLEKSGGMSGTLDLGRLDSVLTHIQNDDYYPTFEEKLTHLVFAVNKGHCFADGNKRTSIALGAFFLEVNGLDVFVSKFIIEMENITVYVAENRIDKELLGEIIYSLVNENEFNEELKLKIIHALE
jgi:death-on-curing protein